MAKSQKRSNREIRKPKSEKSKSEKSKAPLAAPGNSSLVMASLLDDRKKRR